MVVLFLLWSNLHFLFLWDDQGGSNNLSTESNFSLYTNKFWKSNDSFSPLGEISHGLSVSSIKDSLESSNNVDSNNDISYGDVFAD